MGLLDTLQKKAAGMPTNPLAMGLLTYGLTGQGNDPLSAGMQAMMGSAQLKAKTEQEQRKAAQMAAMQSQIASGLSGGSVDPALLAQYAGLGGEGSKEMIDMYKFGKTPQTVTPGSMVYNPTTGAMTMPAPKMGEGQMWDGSQVSNASGYLEAYGNQQAVDARNEIDKYKAQQGIGYQYDRARMDDKFGYDSKMLGNQLEADISKSRAQGQIGYEYGRQGKIDDVGLSGRKVMTEEQAKATSARFNEYNAKGAMSAKQVGKINQLETLIGDGLRTGATQPAYDAIGGYLKDAGIDVAGLSQNQQAQKMILQLAQDIPLPPGQASNIDVQQRLQQLPQLTDTPEAFGKSLQTMRSLAELNQDVADYVNSVGTLTPEVEAEINAMYSEWGKSK